MLRYLIPIFDPEVKNWSIEARLLRWLTLLWLGIGLVVLFSASYAVAANPDNDATRGDGWYYVKRQLIWIWIGLMGCNAIARSPIRLLLKIAPWLVLLCLGLIFLTLTPLGSEVNGATRWIKLGSILLQPSEFMKPALVLQSAWFFGKWRQLPWKVRLTWLGVFAATLAGILLQPNLSTTALCGITIWLIALGSGLSSIYLGGTAITGVLTAFVSVTINEYQRQRIISFLNPWADPRNKGYQLVQSLLAIGSGGTWGEGFGLSQQKLSYLPFQDTDFIFAVFAEEFGFAGGILLLLLLVSYATLALLVAMKCNHRVKQLVALGAMTVMVGQALLNIGVATGALPTTGLPLPLFSYGGSSSLASLILAGLLIRVARESKEAEIVPLRQSREIVKMPNKS
ncbi:MAG: FtsW/RodA/SpoVE family cell cycle protein [Hydrococcus sp. C42_A2020_068]|uniref:FtsW/RodA/SpoVE family cell cycle protein n=1 Tax=Pleurocapsa sp. PCC 7327 TaxID=118163 RepID=UPI00029FC634|nr:FtsW/RodA/SpoVE family cell cycle protein [Pleurocapsa sp. PCC 7327]AFY79632.1 bacterial cell division membrane protein [Pleurocapsa sp. PCC 7327]MBF2021207.1 FtsW/RodA/SpoVE family cell cycle protein [Hydrococcus sp. C42_A2020_068]